uniref:hypothetical protein n=1 Tax=Halopiger xanaduensis TaxID=387343 RepID=UPI0014946EBC|nr:hypothetical protein [Halopiger xanaduensis]
MSERVAAFVLVLERSQRYCRAVARVIVHGGDRYLTVVRKFVFAVVFQIDRSTTDVISGRRFDAVVDLQHHLFALLRHRLRFNRSQRNRSDGEDEARTDDDHSE